MCFARLAPIYCVALLCLAGILLSVPSRADEKAWEPIVVKLGSTEGLPPAAWVPPLPRVRRPAPSVTKAPPAATKVEPPVRKEITAKRPVPPADTSKIITGTVGSGEPTRHLTATDAAHLGEAPEETEPAGVTTGTVRVPDSDLAQRYCANVADAAADARVAWQQAKLAETEREIDERIAVLEAKTDEFKTWLKRRDEFSERANKAVVAIYARMEPDSAAQQLVAMEEETAAAVLVKLNPRNASAILNEMRPEKAARLTATIAGAARVRNASKAPAPAATQRASNDRVEPNRVGRR